MLKILVFSKQPLQADQNLFDVSEIDARFASSPDKGNESYSEWRPDVLVFRQVRRNEFTREAIDAAIRQFPLAARVMLYGPWCEGETRSGRPEQGLHRVHESIWHQQLHLAIGEFSESCTTHWHRPVAGLRQHHAGKLTDTGIGPLQVVAISNTPGFSATMAEFCDARGWSLQPADQSPQCDVVVIECYFSVTEAIELESSFREQFGRRPVVVICGFPREQDDAILAKAFSRHTLIGKPFSNCDLHQA
ncbi:MAG: hypothetical protein ACR2NP_20655, partial [Pirellulaceae bacterium]